MAVILAYGSPALGHLYPMTALLHELAGRGHRIHLRTLAAEVDAMRAIGIQAESVDPRIEAIVGDDQLERNAFGVLKATIDVLCRRAVLEVDDLRRAMTSVAPDVVI
ncbi:MAG: glycosyl transferase, partial [Mycobacterium sp. 20-66-4]